MKKSVDAAKVKNSLDLELSDKRAAIAKNENVIVKMFEQIIEKEKTIGERDANIDEHLETLNAQKAKFQALEIQFAVEKQKVNDALV